MKGNGIFTIDGLNLRLWVTSLKRKFAVTDSENSGRVQSAEISRCNRDILQLYCDR